MLSLDPLPLAFDRRDAMEAGWSRHQFHLRVRRDDVVTLAPRVFADRVAWHLAPREARHRALVRQAVRHYQGSVASHVSAAVVHGLPTPRSLSDTVTVTLDKARNSGDDADWVDVQRSVVRNEDVVTVDGTAVTTPARTAVDCLRTLSRADGLAIADAVVRGGTRPAQLVDVRRAQTRWPGVRTARWGIGLVDGRRESWLESASVAALDGWLPRPVPQVEVRDRWSGAFVGRTDALWTCLGVVGEADGLAKYRGLGADDPRLDAVADRLVAAQVRADRLRELGLGVVRWGAVDLRAPQVLASRVRAAQPTGRFVWAELSCGVCHEELPDCRCAPALCLPPSARDAA